MLKKCCCTKDDETVVQKRESIKKISSIAYVFLTIGVVAWAVVGLMIILEDIWVTLALPIETVPIGWGWFSLEVQLLRFEGASGFIPVMRTGWTSNFNDVIVSALISLSVVGLFTFVLLYIRSIFKYLKKGGSPFSGKISKAAYYIALGLFYYGIFDDVAGRGFMMIFPAALIALMGYIFDYGRKLQEESDTTL